MSRLSVLTIMLLGSVAAAVAHARDCPLPQSACGAEACCAVNDICCADGKGSCCPVTTPYCCGDGSCAVTPSACGETTEMLCLEYEIPCGGVCIEAGSDCCNAQGDYCPATQVCDEGTCSGNGTTHPMMHKGSIVHGGTSGLLMPTSDPLGPKRTCAIADVRPSGAPQRWMFACCIALGWRFTRAPWRRRKHKVA